MFTNRKIRLINNEAIKDNFYCCICSYPYLTRDDFIARADYFCCHECYLSFAEARKKEWKKGWRPKQDVIDNYIENRRKLYEKGDNNEF